MQISPIPMESLAQVLEIQMQSGGIARLVVTGCSMRPTLRHHKDVVYLSPINRPLKKKDLILYKRDNGRYILHRIVKKPNNGAMVCSGDNQWQPETVREDQVIAVVEEFLRGGKTYTNRHFGLRLWVTFWVGIFPLRRPIIAVRRFLGRIRSKF